MDKYHQELTTPSATTNIENSMNNNFSSKTGTGNMNLQHQRGRGCGFRGRGYGRKKNGSGSMPTCHLCIKYGHVVMECWHRFDEYFVPVSSRTLKKPLKLLLIKVSQASQVIEPIPYKPLHY